MIFLILLVFLTGCGEPSPTTTLEGNAMTMNYRIVVSPSPSFFQKQELEKMIKETFTEVNEHYNIWNPNSELSRLNQAPANQKLPLTENLFKLLQTTDKIVAITEGRFDPTVAPLQKVWKERLVVRILPTEEEIEQVQPAIGWENIHFTQSEFWKDHPLTAIDLGGIAKGYCVDLLAERIASFGYTSVYVEWGGEIRVLGKHPENRPWRIFITRLGDTNPDNALAFVEMENQAIATSGDYLQYWKVEGKKYTHIINPKTGKPVTTLHSASILAENCALADGLATAALLFDTIQESQAWLESLDEELQFWLY